VEGVVELGIMEEHGSGNPEDLNDFGKDGEEDDLGLCRKNWDDSFTPDCM